MSSTYKQTLSVYISSFTSDIAIGGGDGKPFFCGLEEGKPPQSGNLVRSLKAWYYIDRLVGLEIGLTDGSLQSYGTKGHQISETFVIALGEKVVSLKVWASAYNASGENGRCGGFELITDQKRSFNINGGRIGEPYQPELGSGMLVGVFGRADKDINCLGFAFLRRASASLTNVRYPDIDKLQVETKPKEIQTITYDNSHGVEEQEFTFEGSEKVTTEQSWSLTSGLESSVQVQVEAGFPLIAKTKVTTSLSVSVSGTYGRSNTKTTDQSYNFPLKVPPGKRLRATAGLYEGKIETKYTAIIQYTLDTGSKFDYNVSGEYNGISASEVVVTVEHF